MRPPTPATAYWQQRHILAELRPRIAALAGAIGFTNDLNLYQWAQLGAFSLTYKPDLILELGRLHGNSTCLFTEIAHQLPKNKPTIESICWSSDFHDKTLPKLKKESLIDDSWLTPLTIHEKDIIDFDYKTLLQPYRRILLFWDAHGFEVANCVLGHILPLLQNKEHCVIMHDLSDQRYIHDDGLRYGDSPLWDGDQTGKTRFILGNINSCVPQAISIVDFCTRNKITIDSADSTFHKELSSPEKQKEMHDLLGEMFSMQGHWFYFSLNNIDKQFTFPKFSIKRSTNMFGAKTA